MPRTRLRFVVDARGRRVGVILPIGDYNRMLRELEELECNRAYDEAKASDEEPIPFEVVVGQMTDDRARRDAR